MSAAVGPLYARLLVERGEGEKSYAIKQRNSAPFGAPLVRFTTKGVNGKTADDTAIGNLADISDYHGGVFELYEWPCAPWANGQILLAIAERGCYEVVETS